MTAATGEDRVELDALFDELKQNAPVHMTFDVESYGLFFAAVTQEIISREEKLAHPRLQILGLLEARLIDADVILLGGLDETVWPPQARTDAFLNRPMRAALGLTPPERKLGQTAHDFVQAMGNRQVILSRARKRDGAPAVASRFVQRMAALGGTAWEACRERGEVYLHLAREIDRTEPTRCRHPATGRCRDHRSRCARSASASPRSRHCGAIPTPFMPKKFCV